MSQKQTFRVARKVDNSSLEPHPMNHSFSTVKQYRETTAGDSLTAEHNKATLNTSHESALSSSPKSSDYKSEKNMIT